MKFASFPRWYVDGDFVIGPSGQIATRLPLNLPHLQRRELIERLEHAPRKAYILGFEDAKNGRDRDPAKGDRL